MVLTDDPIQLPTGANSDVRTSLPTMYNIGTERCAMLSFLTTYKGLLNLN